MISKKYGKIKKMTERKSKHGRKKVIGMACLATEEQAKLAVKMLNKTKQYVANEYKHMEQKHNLNKSMREQDKRYKKPVQKKPLQETKIDMHVAQKTI